MSQRSYEVTHDMSAFMMVVLIVTLVFGYLLSRSRWLTSEKGHRQIASPMSANKVNPRLKIALGNIIINISNSRTEI
jgi:hypothetical protein